MGQADQGGGASRTLKHLAKLALVLDGEENAFDLADVGKSVEELLDDGRGAVELESEIRKLLRDGAQLGAGDVAAEQDAALRLGNLEAVGREEGTG